MSKRFLAWGVTGGVSLLLATACGATKVHDVGDVDDGGRAGSGGSRNDDGNGGTAGYDVAGSNSNGCTTDAIYVCAGSAGAFQDTAGSSYGGAGTAGTNTAGTSYGGSGTGGTGLYGASGAPTDCFAPMTDYWEQPPTTADQNQVFLETRNVMADTAKNSADQPIFTTQLWISQAYANFPVSAAATDAAILLPSQLSQVAPNLGQLYVTRPDCDGKPAAGHKLTVEFWWKLGGVSVELPTHGVSLGAVSNKGKAVWFEDSAKTYVTGEAQSKRALNTLGKLKVEHTFAEDDATDAGKLTLGVWLLPDTEVASTFYIGSIKWD